MDELLTQLKTLNLPFAYHHFAEGEAPNPPFLCFYAPGSHNFFADGQVFHPVTQVQVELYTEMKQPELEQRVEAALSLFGWEKQETYIESEQLYQIVYEMEV